MLCWRRRKATLKVPLGDTSGSTPVTCGIPVATVTFRLFQFTLHMRGEAGHQNAERPAESDGQLSTRPATSSLNLVNNATKPSPCYQLKQARTAHKMPKEKNNIATLRESHETITSQNESKHGAQPSQRVGKPLHKELHPMTNWVYDVFLWTFSILVDLFFREVHPRGSWKIPRRGPIIFVAAPHANQVSYPHAHANQLFPTIGE